MAKAEELVSRTLKATAAAHERMAANVRPVVDAANAITAALKTGGTVFVFGNGGSAADAQHFAAELVGRYEKERKGWPAIALTTDTSALTAIGNDYGFDRVFARQIEALGKGGDVAIGISTSGTSPNVLRGLEAANDRGMITIALTGRGGDAGKIARLHVAVDEDCTARVQEIHGTLLHVFCELMERELND
ncbi:MAG TPA: D-sedoheptulose 7-phosphate isomerase [Vicinamibacterales bacterium]|nr:D-sedoheptulose 7-phosphate isomerase [Vicinamibacterales bacterium]